MVATFIPAAGADRPDGAETDTPPGALLTTITTLIARGGHERCIADEFARIFGATGAPTHHLGTLLIEQEGGLSFLVSQFRDTAALDAWHQSPRYRQMIDGFESHSLRELCRIERPVARIAVPGAGSGPKWKALLASWLVTFPLLLTIVRLLEIVASGVPFVARIAMTSILMSALITWVISPVVLRITRIWRLSDQQMKIVLIERPAAAG